MVFFYSVRVTNFKSDGEQKRGFVVVSDYFKRDTSLVASQEINIVWIYWK